MHPKNKHKDGYDFNLLVSSCPELKSRIIEKFGKLTIDFSDPLSVKLLNKALLKAHYQIHDWDIPEGFLCPPIPGRMDYLYHLADLMGEGRSCKGLDIGTGSSCIYPILGVREFDWTFIASDIDERALESSSMIIERNPSLKKNIELRHQKDSQFIFKNILNKNETIDFSLCNPPFHSSASEARASATRKIKNLKLKNERLNFGGMPHELWCAGGEKAFVTKMIKESVDYKNQVVWFTTLISKGENLNGLENLLKTLKVTDIKVIEMKLGQKISRILAWTYLTP
jgi:23S rRNA (adenine1618-N6)-methyltransferase